MPSTLVWILAGVVVYSLVAEIASRTGSLPDSVRVSGPITTIHTQRGKQVIDRIASATPSFWHWWGNIGLATSILVMISAAGFVVANAYILLTTETEQTVSDPQNMLVIPGVNDFLPLSAAPEILFGLLVGLIVHEGGHGIYCRVADIDIDSMGVALFTLIPLGAFVDPDEDDTENASNAGQARMFAAGVTNNFALSLVLFALMFGVLGPAFAPVSGAPVNGAYADSPADRAGIGTGDVITHVEGEPVENGAELRTALDDTDTATVDVQLDSGETVTVEREVFVAGAAGDTTLNPGTTVETVNGESIATMPELHEAADGSETITVTTADGSTTEIDTGARATVVAEGGPLASAGVDTGSTALITEFDGEQITSRADLVASLGDRNAGETVTVQVEQNGQTDTHEVTLGDDGDGNGYLGVQMQDGVNGVVFDDFGVQDYPADRFAAILDGDGGIVGFGQYIITLVFLPLIGKIDPTIAANFPGIVGAATNFYTVTGPLSALGGWTFTLFNAVFWTAWINIQLGFFNCIPAYPLDGGHILRSSLEAIRGHSPTDIADQTLDRVAMVITAALIAALVVVVFA